MSEATPPDQPSLEHAAFQWAQANPPNGRPYSTSGNLFLHAAEAAWFAAMEALYPGWSERVEEEWNPTARTIAVAEAQGSWDCHYCGTMLASDDDERRAGLELPHVEHKHPRHLGGTDDPANLVLACIRCNSAKGTTPYDEFMRRRSE